ncbi:MAG: 30S ribosomal protein S6 [Armatimonadota bacterium]
MNTTIRSYEVLYIVDPALTDEQVEAIIAKYSNVVTEQGGQVKAAGKWDKRRLAYEIMGRREGIYILMFFDGEPAVAREVGRVMRIGDDVIRHIITRVEPEHVDTTRIEHPQPPIETVEELAEEEAAVEAGAEPAEEAAAETAESAAAEEAPEEPVQAEASDEAAVKNYHEAVCDEVVDEGVDEVAEAEEGPAPDAAAVPDDNSGPEAQG